MKIDTPPFLENKTESEPWTSILGDQVRCLKWKWTPFLPTHWNRMETSFKSVENQWWVQLGSGHPTPSHIIKHHFKRFHIVRIQWEQGAARIGNRQSLPKSQQSKKHFSKTMTIDEHHWSVHNEHGHNPLLNSSASINSNCYTQTFLKTVGCLDCVWTQLLISRKIILKTCASLFGSIWNSFCAFVFDWCPFSL